MQYTYEEDLNEDLSFKYSWFEPKEESLSTINELKKNIGKTVVILPVFTHSAYAQNGFYDYYNENCGKECLTVKIDRVQPPQYNSGKNAIQVLKLLGYDMVSDIDVHKNPEILAQYDKIILLHNEYVTKEMFDAVDLHPNVVYLYPNALYAEIEYNEQNDEITLVRGHGYPDSSIDNGFDWEFDNTRPYEFDTECANWEFWEIDNGVMLNCYPENIIWKDTSLLELINEK
ncbi:N,N-dimethylformamidase beta subunit family domain-containing protein [Candidatus Nitrosopumilus sp. SW]|uniref:N,N-dimethylformamidase beta subunit family domain-containing protein n=1 Tax=Candidatus Nitrosopumilus sp. SW TaxID=2508726 RepID=UPI00210366AB|nr:N,N-dimethylformamidase beta subunit family domain-containing protein [Candidatus Nitrosopumilus sp. SW]